MTMHTNAYPPLNDDLHAATATQPQEVQQDVDARSCAAPETADSYLQGSTWKASGAAASAGVLVGLLLTRR